MGGRPYCPQRARDGLMGRVSQQSPRSPITTSQMGKLGHREKLHEVPGWQDQMATKGVLGQQALSSPGSGGQESAVKVSQGRAPSDGCRRGPPASPSWGWGAVRYLDLWPHLPNLCFCHHVAISNPPLPSLLQTLVMGLRAHSEPGCSHLKIPTLMTSTKTPFPHMATFCGPGRHELQGDTTPTTCPR